MCWCLISNGNPLDSSDRIWPCGLCASHLLQSVVHSFYHLLFPQYQSPAFQNRLVKWGMRDAHCPFHLHLFRLYDMYRPLFAANSRRALKLTRFICQSADLFGAGGCSVQVRCRCPSQELDRTKNCIAESFQHKGVPRSSWVSNYR